MPAIPVLLDATSIPPNRGGVARYIGGLLRGLEDLDRTVDVVVKREDAAWLHAIAPAHRYRVAPAYTRIRPLRFVWEQLGLPGLVRRVGARVLHSPHYTFPVALGARTVVTLHDATFFSDPAAHSRLKVAFFRLWTRLARRGSRATVTPSAATAAELAAHDRGGRVRNVVAHLGVDRSVFAPPGREALDAFRTAHRIPTSSPWLAFLGTVEPRKQVPALLRAHHALTAADPTTPPILLAGGLGWDEDARRTLTEAGDAAGAPVRYLGYLPIEELAAFLGGAETVVYPSIAEGFGLPVLEAMSCGAAVLTTPRLAIPEVGGDAVAYTAGDVTDATIEAGLRDLLADAPRRAALRTAAVERAATFTWAACAEPHLEVYA